MATCPDHQLTLEGPAWRTRSRPQRPHAGSQDRRGRRSTLEGAYGARRRAAPRPRGVPCYHLPVEVVRRPRNHIVMA
jgi:hypothetical protein